MDYLINPKIINNAPVAQLARAADSYRVIHCDEST